MAGYKANLAELRAIHASEERGVDVAPFGSMRALRPEGLRAPHFGGKVPGVKIPRGGAMAAPRQRRKYYGE